MDELNDKYSPSMIAQGPPGNGEPKNPGNGRLTVTTKRIIVVGLLLIALSSLFLTYLEVPGTMGIVSPIATGLLLLLQKEIDRSRSKDKDIAKNGGAAL